LDLTEDMKAPIILDENGDVSLFVTLEDAARYMEPIDVRNNEYVAYDSEGYRLTLVPGAKNVMITGRTDSKPSAEALKRLLSSFWERATKGKPPNNDTLEQLITSCAQRFGYTK